MKPILIAAACLLSLGAAASVASASHVAGAPVNDDYLESLRLNEDGSRLERTDTLRDVRETTNASVQGDVFNPPRSGGPAEVTTCGPTSFGKTIWYDFYPDLNGGVRLRANGFDTVITVVPFDRRTGVPDFSRAQCVNALSGPTEEFGVIVRGGRAYTVQLGGVGGASGTLEFLFDYLPDRDLDGVEDKDDRCPRFRGTRRRAGCPERLEADVTLRARPTPAGIQIVGLRVGASRSSRVEVRCSRGCRRKVKRGRRVNFGRLGGGQLRAGSRVEIRVTRKGSIGAWIGYRITRGNFKKTERCMNPGSTRPRRRCG